MNGAPVSTSQAPIWLCLPLFEYLLESKHCTCHRPLVTPATSNQQWEHRDLHLTPFSVQAVTYLNVLKMPFLKFPWEELKIITLEQKFSWALPRSPWLYLWCQHLAHCQLQHLHLYWRAFFGPSGSEKRENEQLTIAKGSTPKTDWRECVWMLQGLSAFEWNNLELYVLFEFPQSPSMDQSRGQGE